jgi:hypothetical protein
MLPDDTLSILHSLLKPDGFIGITSWTHFPWYSLVERAILQLPNPPPCPPVTEIERIVNKGQAWNTPSFVQKVLESAGFRDVAVIVEKIDAQTGTPAQFTETMFMPLQLFGAFWPETEREELIKATSQSLKKIAEDQFGVEGPVKLTFEAIVGTGRKA